MREEESKKDIVQHSRSDGINDRYFLLFDFLYLRGNKGSQRRWRRRWDGEVLDLIYKSRKERRVKVETKEQKQKI